MEYWIRLNGEQIGPLTLEEARQMPLTPDTPVWIEGMEDWSTAANIVQLADLFRAQQVPLGTPPPIPGATCEHDLIAPRKQIDLTGCPDNNMGMSIGAVVVLTACCGLIGLLGLVPLLNSMRVRLLFLTGEYDRAAECAKKAKNWSIACYIIAAVYIVGAMVLMSVIGIKAFMGASAGDPSFLGL